MIKITRIVTPSPDQWDIAVEGMRNAMNSWDKSDSYMTRIVNPETMNSAPCDFFLGDADLDLMRRLCAGGSEHRKLLRFLPVQMTVVAPLYWWKEFETYRVGVAENPSDIEFNSCSTMHKIHAKPFEAGDFSVETLGCGASTASFDYTLATLNECRERYLATKDMHDWRQMILLLPSCYNQRRTISINYEVAANIIRQRSGHKLTEWHTFVAALKALPYLADIMGV